MNYKKVIKKIKAFEKQYQSLKKELSESSLLSSKDFSYTTEDKKAFLLLWKKYVQIYQQLREAITETKYRQLFVMLDVNAFILKRHLVIFYYNSIVDTIEILGKHESYVRQLVQDNSFFDFLYIAKYIYRPSNIQIINSPSILISLLEKYIKPEVKIFIEKGLLEIKATEKRFFTDYGNFYYFVQKKVQGTVFHVSKFIGTKIRKIKFSRRKYGLIQEQYLENYLKVAKPGDILLSRVNRKATNISIPGFWKHMALYLGTGEFLKNNFKKEIKDVSIEKEKHYLIESTGEGVCIKEIKSLFKNSDFLGVSRTTFTEEKIKRSIKTALSMLGKGYDYIFNFYSDKHLVCSELVLKSFAKESKEDVGIELKLEQIGIGVTFPPNNFTKLLLEEKRKKHPLVVPIFFIDSSEKEKKSFINTTEELLKSGRRSSMTIFLK